MIESMVFIVAVVVAVLVWAVTDLDKRVKHLESAVQPQQRPADGRHVG